MLGVKRIVRLCLILLTPGLSLLVERGVTKLSGSVQPNAYIIELLENILTSECSTRIKSLIKQLNRGLINGVGTRVIVNNLSHL